MDKALKDLYCELLLIDLPNGQKIFDQIQPDNLCLAGHHVGRLYKNSLLIYGQAMNGWQNNASLGVAELVNEVLINASNYKELYNVVDYNGWHGVVNGVSASYYYKRSKFWKLNYQVITNANDTTFRDFYIKRTSDDQRKELLDNAWSQTIAWSNLYKISYSEGGNPNAEIIEAIKETSLKIILREIALLKPNRVLFNTGENLFATIALDQSNVFGLTKVIEGGNILYKGEYKYLPEEKCKIVVCKRPDVRTLHYKNADIINEAKEILSAFESI